MITSEMATRYLSDAEFHAKVHVVARVMHDAWPEARRRDIVDTAILSVTAMEHATDPGRYGQRGDYPGAAHIGTIDAATLAELDVHDRQARDVVEQ